MKALPILFCATALTAPGAFASPVQFQLTYDNLQFRFVPDDNFGDDDVSGFLYPGDTFKYDADAASKELQQTFENSEPFGGAVFESQETGGDNSWVLPQSLNPFSSVTFTLTFDPDDFLKENVIGRNDLADDATSSIGSYSGSISATIFDAFGNTVDSASLLSGFLTGSADDVPIGDGQVGDVIAFGGFEENPNEFAEEVSIGFFFGNLNSLETNWFESLVEGENALEYALNTDGFTRFFEYEEYMVASDGTQLGIYQIQGQLSSTSTATGAEDAPLLPGVTTVSESGVPTYNFEVEIPEDTSEPIWIDPDIAVGYVYTIEDGEGNKQAIAGVQAPSFDDVADSDGYLVTFVAGGVEYTVEIDSGEKLLFADVPNVDGVVTEFSLTGIDESLMLDPENPTVFQTGIFSGVSGQFFLTQTPITKFVPDESDVSPVPLPLPAAMLLSGLVGLGLLRRKTAA